MKRILLAVAISFSAATTFAQSDIPSLNIGANIPLADQQMTNINNDLVTLTDAKTKNGLLVMFSCNTCPFVVKAEARTQEAIKSARNAGVGVIIINSNVAQREGVDSKVEMRIYGKPKYGTVPYVVDDEARMANAFGATRTPEIFLFNGDGALVYKGAMEDNPGDPSKSTKIYVNTAIKNMLTGQIIDPAVTKSIGCSIKR